MQSNGGKVCGILVEMKIREKCWFNYVYQSDYLKNGLDVLRTILYLSDYLMMEHRKSRTLSLACDANDCLEASHNEEGRNRLETFVSFRSFWSSG